MSYKQLNSWGRTRRPKGLWDSSAVSTKETPVEVTATSASADLLDNLSSVAHPQVNGYLTENQQFLHVMVKDASATDAVDIYGYNYAFGKWAPLLEHDGDGTRSVMSAACGSSGAAQHYIFNISGVDRVAFVKNDSTSIPDDIFAACSSF
jgi:hypothetical protein